jgi:uncharacterized protein (TIGR02145 family)
MNRKLTVDISKKIVSVLLASFSLVACTEKEQIEKTVTDVDGYIYNTVVIGDQVWLTENLKTTRLNNGADIQYEPDSIKWVKLTSLAYCWYRNDGVYNKDIYGALYNWYTVETGKLCPSGWHVPSKKEWQTLANFLGGNSVAGGKIRVKGLSYWKSPNDGGSNSTGFSAMPAGYRQGDIGNFLYLGEKTFWWSCSEDNDITATFYSTDTFTPLLDYNPYLDKRSGISVRCLRD